MWIRSAFWLGNVKPDSGTRFEDGMNRDIVPALRLLPGVRSANALWPERREAQPPQIACQILVEFDSREDVDRMLASPERLAMRAQVLELAGLFDGTISHIDYKVG